jgi:hypothetical protein
LLKTIGKGGTLPSTSSTQDLISLTLRKIPEKWLSFFVMVTGRREAGERDIDEEKNSWKPNEKQLKKGEKISCKKREKEENKTC